MKTLKSVVFLVVAVALIGFQSCEEVENFGIVELDMTSSKVEFVLDVKAEKGDITLSEEGIETNVDELFEQYLPDGFDKERIQSIRPKKVSVRIVDQNPAHDFSALDYVELKATPEGFDELLIAKKDMSEETGTEVELELEDIDVADYIDAQSLSYKVLFRTNKPITAPVTLEVEGTYILELDLRN